MVHCSIVALSLACIVTSVTNGTTLVDGLMQYPHYIGRTRRRLTNLWHDHPSTFLQGVATSQSGVSRRKREARKKVVKYNVTTLAELDAYWNDTLGRFRNAKDETDYDHLIRSVSVVGDTQMIGSSDYPEYTHPVIKLIHERRRNKRQPSQHNDGCKLALSIEGGGMRGCISAGMACAVHYLNLTDAFDVVYGSSAGTIVGAYLITGQLPWFGPEVYYDRLTTAGREFIDTRRFLRALGLGLLDPRLLCDVITRPGNGKPILNLQFLLKTTLQNTKKLDWTKFSKRQAIQPLKVIASGLKSEKAIIMDMQNGSFETLDELTDCMHASCLLPGIAGPPMNLRVTTADDESGGGPKLVVGNNMQDENYEPMADGLIYEPMPYRSAVAEGATHVVMIRSRPDGVDVTGKGGFLERLIFRRFFMRKNRLPNVFARMARHLHKKLYAEDVIRLNEHALDTGHYKDTSQPHILTIAAPPGSPEITRLETDRKAIFEGLRRGFARAYDCLVENPKERGRGMKVAKQCFPDVILDYDPLTVRAEGQESAFEAYLREIGLKATAPDSDAAAAAAAAAEEEF